MLKNRTKETCISKSITSAVIYSNQKNLFSFTCFCSLVVVVMGTSFLVILTLNTTQKKHIKVKVQQNEKRQEFKSHANYIDKPLTQLHVRPDLDYHKYLQYSIISYTDILKIQNTLDLILT